MLPRTGKTPEDPQVTLTGCLDGGQTGCLTTRGGPYRVYVMLGEVLAAQALDDDARLLNVLSAAGHVGEQQADDLRAGMAEGRPLPELLFDVLPEEVLLHALFERFRDNLFQFLLGRGPVEFQSMDAVFTENIQVAHDSRALVAELVALRAAVAGLLAENPTVETGAVGANAPDQASLAVLCTRPASLVELLAAAPWEPSRTVALVDRMLRAGTLVRSQDAPPPEPVRPPVVTRKAPGRAPLADDESVGDEDTADGPLPTRNRRWAAPVSDVEDDLAAFQDYDSSRDGGAFVSDVSCLDRVELDAAPRPDPAAGAEMLIEMEEAVGEALKTAVSLNFSGPKLSDSEAERKLEVVNAVLATIASALQAAEGPGAGQARVQLLVEGAPVSLAPLFKGIEIEPSGRMPVGKVLKNLRKRPAGEHRPLLNRGLSDLVERALSAASEVLDEDGMDGMLERIAGYQQRLGV